METNNTGNQRFYANVQNGRLTCGSFLSRDLDSDCSSNLRAREPIGEFTESSRKRFARYLRNAASRYRVFITLTYPPGFGSNGRCCKRDIAAFGRRYRRLVESTGSEIPFSLVWWQEWQRNGRVHVHLLGTHRAHYEWIARAWFEIVGSENEQHYQAGTQIKKLRGKTSEIVSYATKYAVKNEQKQVPIGYVSPGRFWGVIGRRDTVEATTTWTAFKHDDPEVFEAREKLKNDMESMEKAGILTKVVIDKDEYRLVIRFWDPDNFKVRDFLMFHVEQIRKVIANDERNRSVSLHSAIQRSN